MLDLMYAPVRPADPAGRAGLPARPAAPTAPPAISAWAFARMLDVVDYGMLLLADESHVSYANQAARAEMDDGHPLQLLGSELRARSPQDVAALRLALGNALHRRVQALLTLHDGDGEALSVSVVPMVEQDGTSAALIVFGQRGLPDGLSTDAFARQHHLTAAETRVLKLLCTGSRPVDIAAASGVQVSTVRTQVGSIRAKVGTRDIGGIVRRVARLPPLPCLLRTQPWAQPSAQPSAAPLASAAAAARRSASPLPPAMPRPRRSAPATAPALDSLPLSDALRALAARGEPRLVPKGRLLIQEGDVGSTIYIILSGSLRACSRSASGDREVTYGVYRPGEYLGELSLDGGPRSADVEALTASWVTAITRSTLEAYIRERPEFAFDLLAKVIRRARAATMSLRAVALNDVYGRVAWLLNDRAVLQADGQRLTEALTHLEMASLLGCTRPMVSKVMKELEVGGYVACAAHRVRLIKALPARF